MIPQLRTYQQVNMMPQSIPFAICAAHNQEIGQYCRTHQLPLCDYCLQEHTFQDPQMGGFGNNHEFVKIEKIINDAIDHMTKQLQTFDQFIQSKKGIPQYIKAEQVLLYINDDRVFEEAHNHMINRLMKYKNLPNNEKIYYLQQSLLDFDQYYQQAQMARQKIADFIEKSQPQQTHKEFINKSGAQDGQSNHILASDHDAFQQTVGVASKQVKQQQQHHGQPQEELKKGDDVTQLLKTTNGHNGVEVAGGVNHSQQHHHEDVAGLLDIQDPEKLALAEDKAKQLLKKVSSKKKHYGMTIKALLPGQDEPIELSLQSSLKVKNLKQLIKEKGNLQVGLDQIELQIEGGDMLRKLQMSLDECGLRDGSTVMVEIVDKIITQTQPKPKKPAKEEDKIKLSYSVRTGNQDNEEEEEKKQEESQTLVTKTLRIKQLKKQIQDEQGEKDKVTVKLFVNGEEITDDKLSVEDANLLQPGIVLEVEITQKVSIEVQGKGKGYQQEVFVKPTDPIEVLKSKVHFFKLFLQRKQVVVEKTTDALIDDFSKTFRDYGLKDGTQLVMKEPGKQAYKTLQQKRQEEEEKQAHSDQGRIEKDGEGELEENQEEQ